MCFLGIKRKAGYKDVGNFDDHADNIQSVGYSKEITARNLDSNRFDTGYINQCHLQSAGGRGVFGEKRMVQYSGNAAGRSVCFIGNCHER